MSIPKGLKKFMIENDVSVVDLSWKKLNEAGTSMLEVLKWERANRHLFEKARKTPKAESENSTIRIIDG